MKTKSAPLIGAAFLMATSAIGPGFLTQTALFTAQLAASFGFAIAVSIALDIVVQLNIWRIITVSGKPAQHIANELFPGIGYILTLLIVFGGLAFNIGNIAGAGLGMNVLFGFDPMAGAAFSCIFAISVFIIRQATVAMDWVTKVLGFSMIALTIFVAWKSKPPLALAFEETVMPTKIDLRVILTIVGGTVGGYITFAGAHRLLDAGIRGTSSIVSVTKSAITAISLASIMRILLFLASLGVVMGGAFLDSSNPAAPVFRIAVGEAGYKLFGIVLWAASITSVIGSAYTSVSFLRGIVPTSEHSIRYITVAFIILSTSIFILIGQPVRILVLAGALNGLILPFAMTIMLIAAHRKKIMGNYQHPLWLTSAGILVILTMTYIGIAALLSVL